MYTLSQKKLHAHFRNYIKFSNYDWNFKLRDLLADKLKLLSYFQTNLTKGVSYPNEAKVEK